ncbi:MAG: hypothetical protein M5U28_22675 [Sandaracinaceae bacterium]|nr:hypothetical protein [Sandaracinaceae bacterium]
MRYYERTAGAWVEVVTLRPADIVSGDGFGSWLAASNDFTEVAIGASSDETAGVMRAGTVRFFSRAGATWSYSGMLASPAPAVSNYFGASSALSADGERLLVGEWGADTSAGTDAGRVHTYVRAGTSWVHAGTLSPTTVGAGHFFGAGVAVSADASIGVVGAPGGAMAAGEGRAVAFERMDASWTESAVLQVVDGAAEGDVMGTAVDLSGPGDRALVTTPGNHREARVYVRSGTSWSLESLLETTASGVDTLGRAAAMARDGSRLVLGDQEAAPEFGRDQGVAIVFVRVGTGWVEEEILRSSSRSGPFGGALAMSGDGSRLIVGHEHRTATTASVGAAEVFVRVGTSWSRETLLPGPSYQRFGEAVAISDDGTRALVGASDVPSWGGFTPGAAYVFRRASSTWTHEATLRASFTDAFFPVRQRRRPFGRRFTSDRGCRLCRHRRGRQHRRRPRLRSHRHHLG